jgi:hypothetical protein
VIVEFQTPFSHRLSDEEKQKIPRLLHVHRIVEEWVLLEYALVYLPANANAVVGKKKGSRRKKVPEERKKKGSRNPYLARFLGYELDGVTGWAGCEVVPWGCSDNGSGTVISTH